MNKDKKSLKASKSPSRRRFFAKAAVGAVVAGGFLAGCEPKGKKAAVAKIAERFHRSEIWVKKIKANALKKMTQPHVKEIIEKYLEN